jgi:hypothetical protein
MRKSLSAMLLLSSVVGLRATTLSSNLGETVSSTEFVGGDTWITSSFATDSSAYLPSNAVLLLSGTSDAVAKLYLYSNSSGHPGTSLGLLQLTSNLTSSLTPTSFSGNNLPLAANSNYWLVLQASAGDVEWAWTTSTSGSGVGFQHTWGATDDGGGSWITFAQDPMIFSVTADPANSAVPEPNECFVVSAALVLFGSCFRWRQGAQAPEK